MVVSVDRANHDWSSYPTDCDHQNGSAYEQLESEEIPTWQCRQCGHAVFSKPTPHRV